MQIEVEYVAQMRSAAGGVTRETVTLAPGATVRDLVAELATRHGDRLAGLLLAEDGEPRSSTLVFVGEEQVDWECPPKLADSAKVTFLAPLAGG